MNDRVGPISFPLKKQGEISKKPYSDKLAKMIDEVVSFLFIIYFVSMEVHGKHWSDQSVCKEIQDLSMFKINVGRYDHNSYW